MTRRARIRCDLVVLWPYTSGSPDPFTTMGALARGRARSAFPGGKPCSTTGPSPQ
eukprot:CAMPEP_0172594118 /NCGR_PEP_ID=MMETSP1068-20121228/13443_1 /TAXON_ID=35684 /ORGANISM="Pseudopedinella elastica, Strain CCMP716" /LENGTH=54 /DNA_ID=CAMNT_0013391973 /DNA_START=189 /DNA_END=350 /DNA_ORIENTATION=+